MTKLMTLAALLLTAGNLWAVGQSDAEKKIRDQQAALTSTLKTPKSPAETLAVADALFDLSEDAVRENLYDLSLKLLDQSSKVAPKDAAFASRVSGRMTEVRDIQKEHSKAKAALKTVMDSPEDPEANLLVGKFLCFHKGEWELGVVNLVKGSDKELKAAAEKELAANDAKGQIEAGHAWWTLGEKKSPDQAALRTHALAWYEKSWDALDKVERLLVRDRARTALSKSKGDKPLTDGPSGWTFSKTIARLDDRFVKSGATSLLLCNPSTPGDIYVMQYVPVQEGETYEVSAWVLSDGDAHGSANAFFRLKEGSAEGKSVSFPSDKPFWTLVKFEVKAPANAVTCGVQIKIAVGAGKLWADDVTFKKSGTNKNLLDNGSFEKK